MQFIAVFIATLAAVASASPSTEKRSCVASELTLTKTQSIVALANCLVSRLRCCMPVWR